MAPWYGTEAVIDDEAFHARNSLEEQLLALVAGDLSEADFIGQLLEQEVFLPVRDDAGGHIGGLTRSSSAVPLVVEAEGGVPVVLLFSSPDRARPVLTDFEGFGGGILTEVSWLLERIEEGVGLSLNPGWEQGIDLEPDTVAELMRRSREPGEE